MLATPPAVTPPENGRGLVPLARAGGMRSGQTARTTEKERCSQISKGRRITTPSLKGNRPPHLFGATGGPFRSRAACAARPAYLVIALTTPAPTVRPPSRIVKRCPTSIAIGAISLMPSATLSPGITISVPSGSSTVPVTSVVRK